MNEREARAQYIVKMEQRRDRKLIELEQRIKKIEGAVLGHLPFEGGYPAFQFPREEAAVAEVIILFPEEGVEVRFFSRDIDFDTETSTSADVATFTTPGGSQLRVAMKWDDPQYQSMTKLLEAIRVSFRH